jgi:hypothetical protein
MPSGISRPEKEGYLLVQFQYGDPLTWQYAYYTDWGQDTAGYISTPGMEVDVPENVGTMDEREARIVLPVDAFTGPLSSGLPHSPIFIKVTEVTVGLFSGDATHELVTFNGRVSRAIKNFEGMADAVAMFATPAKSRLDVSMGDQCNHTCIWALFRGGCGTDGLLESSHHVFAEIAAIDGQVVTAVPNAALTSLVSPGGNVDRYWERGYLQKDGCQIGIRIWSILDPLTFILRRRPPNDWLLAGPGSIKFVPGCHKSVEDCRDVWDNEGNFKGLGYAMLPYNPLFENPT